jgi:phospholipid transport system substrate-binding protein
MSHSSHIQSFPLQSFLPQSFLLRLLPCLAALCLLLSAPVVRAQDLGPDQLVRATVDKVIEIIKGDKAIQGGDMKRILEVAEAHASPHFNFVRMTRLAMGANWKQASPAQQEELVRQFRSLLLRTYAVALKEYRNQTIDVRPLKVPAGSTDVQVKTLINQPGAQAIPIDYDMERTPQGWKVYDVTVAGVSLVVNFRSSFDTEIRKSGIDGLVKSMVERNRSASAGTAPK